MKRTFTTTWLPTCLLAGFLSACSLPPAHEQHTDMAARIYTELATYYWQQGYTDIALDRLSLALKQTPDYLPATELLKKIHQQQDKQAL